MDPTLVPSINDAFITPPPPPTKPQMAESSDDLSPWNPPLFYSKKDDEAAVRVQA